MEPKFITFHPGFEIPPEIHTLLNQAEVDIYQGKPFCI